MIRRRLMIAVVIAVGMVLPLPAFAGGSGATIPVRMKNVGRQSVGVNAMSGSTASSK